MDPDRWLSIKKTFQQAIRLEPGKRGPFLDASCKDDVSLRKEIEALIASHDDSTHFLEMPPEVGRLDDEADEIGG